jgi:hypothetical protein
MKYLFQENGKMRNHMPITTGLKALAFAVCMAVMNSCTDDRPEAAVARDISRVGEDMYIPSAEIDSPVAKGHTISEGLATAGWMYWALECPILTEQWVGVFAGTVEEVHDVEPFGCLENPVGGTIKIERVFLDSPLSGKSFGKPGPYKGNSGFNGLQPGDFVIVFVREYDGGYGIVTPVGSNCMLGIKAVGPQDPIVEAVKKTAQHRDLIRELFKDKKFADLWRKYDDIGVDCILRDCGYMQYLVDKELADQLKK